LDSRRCHWNFSLI